RNEDIAALDGPVALSRAHGDADALSRAPLHASGLSGNEHLDTFVAEDSRDRIGDVGILATGQPGPLLDDRDAASEAPVRLRQLEADIPAAEHDQGGRHAVELERLDMREWRGGSQVRNRRDRGMSSYVEERTVSRQHSRSTVGQTDFQRLRRHEPAGPHDEVGAAGLPTPE